MRCNNTYNNMTNNFDYKQGSYWCETGKYQKKYDALMDEYMPKIGEAHESVEMLRLIGQVYYDVYNNGGGNIVGFATEAYARKLITIAPKLGIDTGYVGQQILLAWGENERLDELYSMGEIDCDEHINSYMGFDEDNKFMEELELLMDRIILRCEELTDKAYEDFYRTYGARS